MVCPETNKFKFVIDACEAVVPGLDENGLFIGVPSCPTPALYDVVKFPVADPFIVPAS